jgi:hypothetical protein
MSNARPSHFPLSQAPHYHHFFSPAPAVPELDRLDQSLLARAFSGTLVPQDPAEEPAAGTLSRLSESSDKRLGLANASA